MARREAVAPDGGDPVTEALDIRPAEVGLERLVAQTAGPALAPILLRQGQEFAEEWSNQIAADGLVLTGELRDSFDARVLRRAKRSASVAVGTDVFYARFLEFGTKRGIRGSFTGRKVFRRETDGIVDDVIDEVNDILREVSIG